MHIFVDFILSGGCSLRPSSSVLIHCMDSILYRFPVNPILEMKNQTLFELFSSIKTFTESFALSVYDVDEYLCFLKWIWCGSPNILLDQTFAKSMRRYTSKYPAYEVWKNKMLPVPCRHCGPVRLETELHTSYQSNLYSTVLLTGSSLLIENDSSIIHSLLDIEKHEKPIEYVSTFCTCCCRISVVSYTYTTILKKRMKVPLVYTDDRTDDARAYYCKKIRHFKDIVNEDHRPH
jgi:hypothetical protein